MINKIYKRINNKFSRFFKFIFFLRYLFLIFFVALALFLVIPHFFDYKKKEEFIVKYLFQNYDLNIKKIGNINYKSYPAPHLQIKNLSTNLHSKNINLEIQELEIYPKLLSVYNYNNYQSKKIKFKKSELNIDFKDLKIFTRNISNSKKKFYFKDLDLKVKDDEKEIIELKKIYFSNYGYKKNIIDGEIFDRKFRINFKNGIRKVVFDLRNTGISATLNMFDNNLSSSLNGSLKGKILKSNFKLNFNYFDDKIKINELFFRDKNLSFDSEGILDIKPFFIVNLTSKIKEIDKDILKNLDIETLLKFKDLIKLANFQKRIIFKSKKLNNDLINFLDLNTNLSYGRLSTSKVFFISKSKFSCENTVNILDEFPIIYFNCKLNLPDKKEFFKKIKVNYKDKKNDLNLNIHGNLNILNNKINFDYIKVDESYKLNKEDLKYIKLTFEETLFDKNFMEMFNLLKIQRFILAIL